MNQEKWSILISNWDFNRGLEVKLNKLELHRTLWAPHPPSINYINTIRKHWRPVHFSTPCQSHPKCVQEVNWEEQALWSQGRCGGIEPRLLSNSAEEMTRRKLLCVSGTEWNSKIRKTVANLSIKAGNMIHLFPFMQTQVHEGLCENYFSLVWIHIASLGHAGFSFFSSLWILWLITQQV